MDGIPFSNSHSVELFSNVTLKGIVLCTNTQLDELLFDFIKAQGMVIFKNNENGGNASRMSQGIEIFCYDQISH